MKVDKHYYDNNGNLMCEYCWSGNLLHNPNGPACKGWSVDGKLTLERYFINGNRHREDGPAIKLWNKNLYYEVNVINDKLARINGYTFRFYIDKELVYQI